MFTCVFWMLSATVMSCDFLGDKGYPDSMVYFTFKESTIWPIQESPIFGIEYNGDRKAYRFLTMRRRNTVIVEFSNFWVSQIASSGRWSARCPKNMLMMGISCFLDGCNNMRVLCGKTTDGFTIKPNKFKIVLPKTSSSSLSCPKNMFAQGMECFGSPCSKPGLYCVELDCPRANVDEVPLLVANNYRWASADFGSEDSGGGYSWGMEGPMYGMHCLGSSLCDRMKLESIKRGRDRMIAPNSIPDSTWVGPVSSIGSSAKCPPNMLLHGFRCLKQSCSEILLRCNPLVDRKRYRINEGKFQYSTPFGNFWPYNSHAVCSDGYYAKSLACLHHSCSVLVLGCVSVSIRE